MIASEQALRNTEHSAGSYDPEPKMRPKTLKRPAQFSVPPPPLLPLPIAKDLSEPLPALAPASLAWQDDGRFAVPLLAIILVLNIAVGYWLAAPDRMIKQIMPVDTLSSQTPIPSSPPLVNEFEARPDAPVMQPLDSAALPELAE